MNAEPSTTRSETEDRGLWTEDGTQPQKSVDRSPTIVMRSSRTRA